MKNLKTIIPLVIVIIVIAWGTFKLISNKKILNEKAQETETIITEIPVNTVKAEFLNYENELNLTGTFSARKELNVIAETQGTITQILANEGDNVSKGQLLVKINDATFSSQLATAKAALKKAEKDLERYGNLLEVGAISLTQYEEIRLDVQNKSTNLTSVQQQLQNTNIKSPLSGVIKEVVLEQGSFASPGTVIASVVDISSLKMKVNVDEKDVIKIKENQKVEILTEVYPNTPFVGTITQIGVQANEARKYEITIELKNDNKHPLKAGMYGTVNIPTDNQSNASAIAIPRKSVVGSLQNPQVYLAKDGKAVLVDVEIGKTIEEMVFILNGIKEGDDVIVTGQINLDNGRAIKVINEKQS